MNITIIEFMTGVGADVFNFYFTIVAYVGWLALMIGLLVKVLTRS